MTVKINITQNNNEEIKQFIHFFSLENNYCSNELLNIIKDYNNDSSIIKNNSNLIILIEGLINQLKNGNNILIPFLDICPKLIKTYIESNIDEDKDLNYIEIFKLLKINSLVGNIFILYIIFFRYIL